MNVLSYALGFVSAVLFIIVFLAGAAVLVDHFLDKDDHE